MSMLLRLCLSLVLACGLALTSFAQAPTQRLFPSAEAAADTLTEALRKDDDKTIADILGSSWRDFVPGTLEDENRARAAYLEAWDANHKLVPSGDDKVTVEVGRTGFVMPIPIVKEAAGWRFDIDAGRTEMIARQIGNNELAVVQSMLAIVDAQQEYAALDPMKTGGSAYARRLLSSPGQKNGLYWEAKPGEPESPLGPLIAKAQPDDKEGQGYHGYRYRLLYGQGPDAPGGAYSYLVNDRMIGGFGVIAWPVEYGETGVMTFIVSHSGEVYERDLGPETPQRAASILLFDPDKEWQKADAVPP
ncbi:MAG: DUF2950 domain-containing protein [Alphaproteobacteria bacterium]|jgi:hypothetical protein|nr:MAG: DUF2950 domain-containing protein [Alphaproteobacteria bacterium]